MIKLIPDKSKTTSSINRLSPVHLYLVRKSCRCRPFYWPSERSERGLLLSSDRHWCLSVELIVFAFVDRFDYFFRLPAYYCPPSPKNIKTKVRDDLLNYLTKKPYSRFLYTVLGVHYTNYLPLNRRDSLAVSRTKILTHSAYYVSEHSVHLEGYQRRTYEGGHLGHLNPVSGLRNTKSPQTPPMLLAALFNLVLVSSFFHPVLHPRIIIYDEHRSKKDRPQKPKFTVVCVSTGPREWGCIAVSHSDSTK